MPGSVAAGDGAQTGLVDAVTAALVDTYRVSLHAPGRVFADLAVAVADGADAISGIACWATGRICSGRWRRCRRRGGCWTGSSRPSRRGPCGAGGGPCCGVGGRGRPGPGHELRLDFDATITIAHSEKENAAATWKKTFGFHPLLCFLDRPDVAGGEALAGLLRPGNAGSNTAADHIAVLDLALAALPEQARPRPGDPTGPAAAGPVGLRRRHPRVRRRLPRPRGRVLLRIPRRLADPDDRG